MIYFTFAEALTALKMGFEMRRECWKKGYYIKIVDGNIIAFDDKLGVSEKWDIEHYHLLADDWCKHFAEMDASRITVGEIGKANVGDMF